MVTIEFLKRTPVNGFWLLPGTRAEFATAGQAGFFTHGGGAKIVSGRPKRKTSANPRKNAGPDDAAGDVAGSEAESTA